MSTRFGWCITNQHTMCTHQFAWSSGPVICDCPCHNGAELPELGEWVALPENKARKAPVRRKTT